MKKYLYTIAFLSLSIAMLAQTSNINFETGDWESILKKAQAEEKIIFVDAYTTWCGPCKQMAKQVFTDQQVSDYYNEHFINAKIDMEKGEGLLFAKAYDIRAYPTYVFVDGRGNMAHKGLGFMPADKFIAFGEAASDEDTRLGTLASRYENGDREATFLKQYAEGLANSYDDAAADVAHEYLKTQDDWNSEANAQFIVDMVVEDPSNELYQYMLANRSALAKHADAEKIDYKLKIGTMREIYNKKMTDEDAFAYYKSTFPEKGEEFFAEYKMRKYSRMTDEEMTENYLNAATEYINNFNVLNWQTLNQVAWTFYESTDDKTHLMNAAKWAEKSVKADSNYMNNDTLAAVYFKLGKKGKALKAAHDAIALAKENNEDYTETEKLLDKINAL